MRVADKAFGISGAAGLLGLALILVATSRYGVGLSADSVTYLSTAQNLVKGQGYISFDGGPLLVFPPLFSTLVAVVSGGGWLAPETTARWINAICFSVVIFVSTYLLIKHISTLLLALLGASAVLLSVALIEVSVYAWSEPLFVLFTLLALLLLQRFEVDNSVSTLIIGGVFSALACLTRYAGVTLVFTGSILILTKQCSLIERVKWLIYFLFISLLPITVWCLRNYMISSTLTGYRPFSDLSIAHTMYQAFDILSLWLLPDIISRPIRIISSMLFIITITLIVANQKKRHPKLNNNTTHNVRLFCVFIGIHLLFTTFMATYTTLDTIDNRLLSPVFIPLALVIFFTIDNIFQKISNPPRQYVSRMVLNMAIALWISYQLFIVTQTVNSYLVYGAGGFHTSEWAASETIDYLKENQLAEPIYSNEPYAIYALTGKVSYESPQKNDLSTNTANLMYFQKELQTNGSVYLVWFNTNWWRQYLYDVDELSTFYDSEKIVARKDGAIYLVRSRALPCCASIQH